MAFPRAIGSKLPAARQPTRNLTPPRAESLTRRPAATGPKAGATEKLQVDGSNAGQALWGGIADPDHARAVARRLVGPELFNGWGIRTMGAAEAAYDPDDYQSGSIWPHDNSIIVDGLRRYGFDAEAEKIFKAIFEVAQQFPDGRLPELFAGYRRTARSRPIPYPETCSPQAWAAGAIPFMLTSSLGLEPDAISQRLRVVRPALPAFLGEVTVRGLRVGEATLDLRWRRKGGRTTVQVLGKHGRLRVEIER
jgi:glycogen debranching enzyme